ncbi:MAG: CYTH domain-containing protein [Patescibacteria group bacterium]
MAHVEVEIKSLLGEKANADKLKDKMCSLDPECACVASNKQLNHYFEGGDIYKLYEKTEHLFKGEQHEKFKKITDKGSDFSVRTRQKDEEVLLVVKASIDEGDSANTVSRLEFEEPACIGLDDLDALVRSAGYQYQAKWSREREEYVYKNSNVCIDRNAGYGYLAEFEKVVPDGTDVQEVRKEIESLMAEVGALELPQDRLARMFEHYNKNWSDYYGTEKTFVIE